MQVGIVIGNPYRKCYSSLTNQVTLKGDKSAFVRTRTTRYTKDTTQKYIYIYIYIYIEREREREREIIIN